MDKAKPGHTVEFNGLLGATHLNGTTGTLIRFIPEENRWVVQSTGANNRVVKAKPENLILHRSGSKGGRTEYEAGEGTNSSWANGLSPADQYEWLSNCYQMRCDDDYQYGGCFLHGPYNPEATPESIADDFLVFCLLAHRSKVVPTEWNWSAFLKVAAKFIPFAFEKSDAKQRWGSENVFAAKMGGRSLRYTAMQIYGSAIDSPADNVSHETARCDVENDKNTAQQQVGGLEAWQAFVQDLGRCNRFAGFDRYYD